MGEYVVKSDLPETNGYTGYQGQQEASEHEDKKADIEHVH